MLKRGLLVVVPLMLALAGCTTPTPQDRIGKNRDLYESFPSDVQRKISEGKVDIGFTPDMAALALGKPGRKFTRADAKGESEVWVYYKSQPRIGLGFGVSSGGHRSGVGTGVSVSSGGGGDEEVLRVVFHDGLVSAIERVGR